MSLIQSMQPSSPLPEAPKFTALVDPLEQWDATGRKVAIAWYSALALAGLFPLDRFEPGDGFWIGAGGPPSEPYDVELGIRGCHFRFRTLPDDRVLGHIADNVAKMFVVRSRRPPHVFPFNHTVRAFAKYGLAQARIAELLDEDWQTIELWQGKRRISQINRWSDA